MWLTVVSHAVLLLLLHTQITIQSHWQYGQALLSLGRVEQAMSLYQKTLRLCKAKFGNHLMVFDCEVSVVRFHARTHACTATM